MKTTFLVILTISSLFLQAQDIGDKYDVLINLKKELNITSYGLDSNHFEMMSELDTVCRIFLIDYKKRIIFGIDYLFLKDDHFLSMLSHLTKDSYQISRNTWITNNDRIIYINRDLEIFERDLKLIKKRRLKRVIYKE